MRLPRQSSITAHADFARVRQQGEAKGGKYLVLSSLKGERLSEHKAAVIVTKKVGNAVTRNRLRRRVQHIYAKHLKEIEGTRYLVTILRWRAPEASFQQLEADWLKQAGRLKILNPQSAP